MTRPLVICDCDEVLLHMVRHFRDWLGIAHDVDFRLEGNPFAQPMIRRSDGAALAQEDAWRYLTLFFDTEMPRQTEIEGAAAAIAELRREADVVILTNLADEYNAARRRQLLGFGIDVPVYTNQGPKGAALRRILDEHDAASAVFIDDLAHHHASVAQVAPHVRRLHFCGEPAIAPHVECAHIAGHAHARIDDWERALPWLLETLHGEQP